MTTFCLPKQAVGLLCLLIASIYVSAQSSIHYWNFNAGASTTTSMKWPSPISATTTANYGSINHGFDQTDNFGGSTLDATGFTSTAGDAFCVIGTGNNDLSLIINASTLGFRDIQLTYATRGTASGYSTHVIDYTFDGTNYSNISTITGRTATSFSLQTIDFTGITSVNNNPNFKVRITVSGATATSGNNRFDNIRITGNPAPCSPTNQPTSLNLTPGFNTISGSFTPAAPGTINATAYLVLVSTVASLSEQPVNGQVYNADDEIGNAVVVSADNSTGFNVNLLQPGTAYYFFVYSYDAATNCYNLTSPLTGNVTTTTPPACSAPSTQASGLSATVNSTSINLGYTRGNGDKVLIIAKIGSPVNYPPFNSVTYSSGSQTGPGNTIIYNGTASSFNYTGLTPNTTYYFAIYEFNDAGVCYNQAALTGNYTTSCTAPVGVTAFAASAGNGQVSLSWNNPSSPACYDQVMVVASSSAISGAGGDYAGAANPVFSSGPQVVYRALGTSVTVTNLSNNTPYFFKVFTRLAGVWSAGVDISSTPFNPATGYQYLFGNLHSHSSYSDGNKDNTSKTPKDDYEFARDANCMDFLGISEHNHKGAGMNYPDYLSGYNQANLVNGVSSPTTGNSIVTLWGMEWGVISNGGHVLVYGFNDKLIGWEAGNYDLYVAKNDYSALWSMINAQSGAFATLAHPHFSDYNSMESAFNSNANNAIAGTAVESGPAFSLSTSYDDFPSSLNDMDYFRALLARGYHVAPQIDHDNHNMTFGTVNTNRTVVLATAKTRTALMEALKARRYYASQDCNVRIDYKNGSSPMGSIVTKGGRPSLTLTVTDPDSETVNTIQLWGGAIGGAEPTTPLHTYNSVSSFNFTSGDAWNTQPNNTSWYYFAIITQADGNKIVTAPIWYTRSDVALPVTLTKFDGEWADAKTRALLTWSTAREINSKSFIVQRSTDKGQSWQDIAELNAGGTTVSDQHYQFTDLHPGAINWYRLKMVDIDGDYTYSRVVILSKTANTESLFTIYPNPASSFVKIQSNSAVWEKLNIRVTDLSGRIIQQQASSANSSTPATVSVAGMANGIYLLWINGKSHKLIVGQ